VPKLSLTIGALLILLGILSYVLTGAESITALIPAFFGIVFALLGYVAGIKESWKKHAMHAALLFAILGLFGSFGGIPEVFGYLSGNVPERPAASIGRAIMALLCIVFLVLGVKSFIDARKAEG
jgi:hypothetical protein